MSRSCADRPVAVWCSGCGTRFASIGYLNAVFRDDVPALHAAALVTRCRHTRRRSYDRACASNAHAKTMPWFDHDEQKELVNEQAKRQLVRTVAGNVGAGTYPQDVPIRPRPLIESFGKLRNNDLQCMVFNAFRATDGSRFFVLAQGQREVLGKGRHGSNVRLSLLTHGDRTFVVLYEGECPDLRNSRADIVARELKSRNTAACIVRSATALRPRSCGRSHSSPGERCSRQATCPRSGPCSAASMDRRVPGSSPPGRQPRPLRVRRPRTARAPPRDGLRLAVRSLADPATMRHESDSDLRTMRVSEPRPASGLLRHAVRTDVSSRFPPLPS